MPAEKDDNISLDDDIDATPDEESQPKRSDRSFQELPTWEEAIEYLLDPSLVGKKPEGETSRRSSKSDASKGKSSGRRGRRRR